MFQNCILGQKRNGFFIESGAYTGEYLSNSLYFEIKRNYSGLFDTNWYFPTIKKVTLQTKSWMNNLTMFYRIVIQDIRHNLDLEQRLHRLCNTHNVCQHSFLTPHILHVLIKIIIMLILNLQYHLIIYGKLKWM